MPSCPVCGEFYQPTPEEERLIVAGDAPEMCMTCAIRVYKDSEKDMPLAAPAPLRETHGKTDGTKLARVEMFDAAGRSMFFAALPPLPPKETVATLIKEKEVDKDREATSHVLILSETGPGRKSTEPRIILHSNVYTFSKSDKHLWFRKIPEFWCPYTGRSHIRISSADVKEICKVGDQTTSVSLNDGRVIRLYYR